MVLDDCEGDHLRKCGLEPQKPRSMNVRQLTPTTVNTSNKGIYTWMVITFKGHIRFFWRLLFSHTNQLLTIVMSKNGSDLEIAKLLLQLILFTRTY